MDKEQRERKQRYRKRWQAYGGHLSYSSWLEETLEKEEADTNKLKCALIENQERFTAFTQCISDVELALTEVDKAAEFRDIHTAAVSLRDMHGTYLPKLWRALDFVTKILRDGKRRYEEGVRTDWKGW